MLIILEIIAGIVVSYIVITTIIDICLMGRLDIRLSLQGNGNGYIIRRKNKIDIQTGYQCSAFSVAYLLRHYGILASGEEIYPDMPDKMKDGCVYPKGLCRTLLSYGFEVRYCSGNLKALQQEICKGNPVIVMIRVRKDRNWLHYVPVVGFNDKYVFIAESLAELINCDSEFYNRRVEKKEFLQLWNTAMLRQPLYRNTFIVVNNKEKMKDVIYNNGHPKCSVYD